MTTRRAFLAIAIASSAIVGAIVGVDGCRRKSTWPPSPANVALGEDTCADCRMIVGDDRFGAQLQDRTGNLAVFDDAGCLRAYVAHRPFEIAGVFARSYRSRGWVAGDRAWVVESRELPSPMGHGVAAFEDEATAREEAARHADGKARSLADYLSSSPFSALISGGP
jgi:copper chaperone NosL